VTAVDIVVPTVGRHSLTVLLRGLDTGTVPFRGQVIVVDDRRDRTWPLSLPSTPRLHVDVRATSRPSGPAAARNVGWRAARADWVAFLDDDVVPAADWVERLYEDVAGASRAHRTAASQGVLTVPLPRRGRPTAWERDVAGLAGAAYITADIVYRRSVLQRTGGFDEHFTGAYREDADLALRVLEAGHVITRGRRRVEHPVAPAPWNISVRRQQGNAADARMRRKHGRTWRCRARAGRGRLPLHVLTTAALAMTAAGAVTRSRRVLLTGAGMWVATTSQFAWARLRPGPRDVDEITRVLVTSALIPPVAVWHRLRGELRERRRVRAALFDRDGTLVVDVPYNDDPSRVQPVAGAGAALARLRAHGVQVAVVTNQSGVARGLLDLDAVRDVNRRVEELLGPFGSWQCCPHDERAACNCRKPRPGMVHAAARALGVPARRCVVIGDTQADVDAATAAGCLGILVPNERTRPAEIALARAFAPDLDRAVDLVLGVSK
jgi:histidinol-phosphate phosphatase family protein